MRGVAFNRQSKKWRATLRGYGNNGYIGEFATEFEAMVARRAAEKELHLREHDRPEIKIYGDAAFVPVMGARGRQVATAVIDAADLPIVGAGRWSRVKSGYAVQRRDGRFVYMHRLIEPDGEAADHIDGDKMNNRRANLRSCTQAENSRNRRRLSRNNSSGVKGVSRVWGSPSRWRARIWLDRREIFLGSFATKQEALAAYAKASEELHGEFGAVVQARDVGEAAEVRVDVDMI